MKIYISADIEGVTGITDWDETEKGKSDYNEFREQMTAEVAGACEGALAAGAAEIWVRDAHGTARNLITSKLPREVRLIRGWSGHPFFMTQELDKTFDGVIMIGYHSRADLDANPLAHSMSRDITHIKVNERYASEFLLHAYAAASVNVPVVLLSGDEHICREAESVSPQITTVPVMRGAGGSSISIHPKLAVENIRHGVEKAVKEKIGACRISLPDHFSVEVRFQSHIKAFRASFFPGIRLRKAHTVQFEADDYFEVMRAFLFIL
ncbi:M55 family metallopeptidase [Desulfococcaceae bacterium HSG8]|nr:M55 family metallopeptidase [Desulfococcaceae bacterium HSG8]